MLCLLQALLVKVTWNICVACFQSDVTSVFFFNDTATTEIYALSLHAALPICSMLHAILRPRFSAVRSVRSPESCDKPQRSEEHTSELQSLIDLVCRLLLE